MKVIGMLGGMSWESTASYYQQINEGIKQQLGGLHSAKIALYSVDFEEVERQQQAGEWQAAGELLSNAAKGVEAAGADFLMICTNTMHKVADQIENSLSIPLLHIADATAKQLLHDGITRVGLLGTAFTMSESFYKGRLSDKFGLEVITPTQQSQKIIHDVIYQELCLGVINDQSREQYLAIIEELSLKGAEAVILGCTEIGLLVKPEDTDIALYDTTAIHAQAAVCKALEQS